MADKVSHGREGGLGHKVSHGREGGLGHKVSHGREGGLGHVEIFTDGACRGNPGPGGWGALLRYGNHEKELFGGEAESTNNRMELMAAIRALESLKRSCIVSLTTDSSYVRDGIMQWLPNWKKRGWKTSARKPVKNADLWRRLDQAVQAHQVTWHWVRGHSGHPENERADQLANRGIDEL